MAEPRPILDTLFAVGPKAAGGALTLALGLALVGVFDPADYGRYALAVTLVLLADAVIGTPFDLAVIRLAQTRVATDPAAALAVERLALRLKLGLGLALAVAAAVPARAAAPGLMPLVAAAALSLLALRSALLHLQMRGRFRAYGLIEAAHVALKLGPAFALILAGAATPWAVLACLAAGPLLALGLAVAVAAAAPFRRGPAAPAAPVLRLLRWYGPTLALGATLGQLDILMLGALAPGAPLGAYAAAAVAASVPALLGMYLAVVLTPTVVLRAAAGRLRGFFARMQLVLTAAAAALGAAAVWAATGPAAALLPGAWGEALPLFLVLLPGTLVAMTTSAMALPLVLVARQRAVLLLDACVGPVALLAYAAAIPAAGGAGAAAVALAVMLVRSLAVLAVAWAITAAPAALAAPP
jgi:O-antigen/teichoic acid export membrane protein